MYGHLYILPSEYPIITSSKLQLLTNTLIGGNID